MADGHDSLGYMTQDQWKRLDEENRSWFLYNTLIIRCTECRTEFDARYEPKRSTWGSVFYLALISICSFLGGIVAGLLGHPIPWTKQ